jgi:tRNA(Arg) A34 adenosine deaminase TadA
LQNAARTDQLARRVEETQRSTDDRLTHAETEAAKAAAALNGLFRRTDEVLTATP